jgi:flagellar biosynthesis protein FliP
MRAEARMIAIGAVAALGLAAAAPALGAAPQAIGVQFAAQGPEVQELSSALKIVLVLTFIGLIPGLLVAVTSFTRIIIVLSMLRQALGMQETPPNMVLTGLALFLTLFTMLPVAQEVNEKALEPYLSDSISIQDAARGAAVPLRDFMVRHTREQDLSLMVEISGSPAPATVEEINFAHLVPAFMLSELRTAFQIGFVIFLPFLLVDLVVSSVLMSMGMLMVPPIVISLPIKILMFVLVDGWALVVRSLVGGFS